MKLFKTFISESKEGVHNTFRSTYFPFGRICFRLLTKLLFLRSVSAQPFLSRIYSIGTRRHFHSRELFLFSSPILIRDYFEHQPFRVRTPCTFIPTEFSITGIYGLRPTLCFLSSYLPPPTALLAILHRQPTQREEGLGER